MAEETETKEEKTDPKQADLFGAVEKVTSKLDAVAQKLEAAAQPKAEKPVRYTEAQIWAAVDDGKLSERDAFKMLRQYDREDAKAEADRMVSERIAESTAQTKVDAKLGEFYRAHPEILREGSEERALADRVYSELLEDGAPSGKATVLAALRIAFPTSHGPARETTTQRTARAETPSAPARPRGARSSASDPFDGFDEREREHYGKMIKAGRYKGADDPDLKKVLDRHRARKSRAA